MKKTLKKYSLIITLWAFIMGLMYIGIFVIDKDKGQLGTFTNGEILLPDYAHIDTLIVVNATALNKIFDVELPEPATDGEISDVLHKYCVPINSIHTDYQLEVDSTGYTIIDNDRNISPYEDRIVAHFPFDQNPVLDSIIYKDND